ncbi:hypothetical protein [Streptomyces sp. NPDC048266]|uniref:hypothetical protein n=1 Tax=Streptomyces sp. NPDC048266 TaxID=3155787 RepID=UPI0033CE1F9C
MSYATVFTTHYAADRRVPGKGLLERIATKTAKGGFYKLADFSMNGAFHLDFLCTDSEIEARH